MRKVLQEIAMENAKLYRFVDLDDERDEHRLSWYSTREKAEAAFLRRHSVLEDQEKA